MYQDHSAAIIRIDYTNQTPVLNLSIFKLNEYSYIFTQCYGFNRIKRLFCMFLGWEDGSRKGFYRLIMYIKRTRDVNLCDC